MGLGKVLHAGPVKGEVGEDESFWGKLVLSQIGWLKCVWIRMKTHVGKGPEVHGEYMEYVTRVWNVWNGKL